jgi:hypothetical protein
MRRLRLARSLHLNERGITTNGGASWYPTTVRRACRNGAATPPAPPTVQVAAVKVVAQASFAPGHRLHRRFTAAAACAKIR